MTGFQKHIPKMTYLSTYICIYSLRDCSLFKTYIDATVKHFHNQICCLIFIFRNRTILLMYILIRISNCDIQSDYVADIACGWHDSFHSWHTQENDCRRTLIKQPIIKHFWSVYYHCIVKFIVVFMGLHWIFESREFPNHTSLSGNTFGNNVHGSSNISDPWNKVYDMCLWQARYISICHYHIRVLNGDFPLKQDSDMNNPWHNHALHADLVIPNINWIVIITHDSASHHFFCRENTGMWDISRCYWNCYPTENASWEQTDHIFL